MGDNDFDPEKPIHGVRLSRPFYIRANEVTVAEFRNFVKATGYKTTAEAENGSWLWTGSQWEQKMDANWLNPYFKQADNNPVCCMSWYDAIEYCNWLSQEHGLTACYKINGLNITCDFSADGFRLPTEAEWEFAARGGKMSKGYAFSGSDIKDDVAWDLENSNGTSHPVGMKKPNELGIYDMSGNVAEWCWDWYENYSSSSQTDPKGPNTGSKRVLRGGSYLDGGTGGYNVDSALREGINPDQAGSYYGFRPVRTKVHP